jgi:long-chain acyl-CoA synthetase
MALGSADFKYHKDDGKTAANRRDGFFTVGDVGYLDPDGYLFLCDRKIDMIISGGVNIYPSEVEAALLAHPKIADAAVFGIPHEDWGEEVKAVVEPAPGVEAGPGLATEILAFCAETIAKYKCPRSVDFVSSMPRDPNGKLYKRKLRDPYWAGRERAI